MNFLHNWALLFVQKCVHKAKQMSYRWCEKMHSTVYLSCSKASRFSVGSNKHKFLKVGSLSFGKSTDEANLENWYYTSFGPENCMLLFPKKFFLSCRWKLKLEDIFLLILLADHQKLHGLVHIWLHDSK